MCFIFTFQAERINPACFSSAAAKGRKRNWEVLVNPNEKDWVECRDQSLPAALFRILTFEDLVGSGDDASFSNAATGWESH